MSDGQDKSDDLIAELAKLMASSAGGAEPEPKAGPKLVSTPEPIAAEPRPAGPTIRIPGMDAPVVAAPRPAPAPAPVGPAPQAATSAPTIRIPGMDQPVVAASRTVAPPPVAPVFSVEPKPVETRAPSIDFGTLPPAATIRPEPMSNWQDREIPKPVAARPSVAAEPVLTAPAPKPAAPAPTPAPFVASPASTFTAPAPVSVPVKLDESRVASPKVELPKAEPRAATPDAPVIAGRPAPAGDSFDFDFGFDNSPPEPTNEARVPLAAPRPAVSAPAPAVSTGDPIADLITAELDAAIEDEPAPVPARPPVQPPAIRSFPAANVPAVQQPPQQQRAVTTNPVRPPVAPPVAATPQPKPAAEPERIATAPVFGVGGKPAAPVERDPMDEIESLIGEAVRVELSASEKPFVAERPKQVAAPVVPPLTTGFAPRRAAIKDTEPQVTSAEAAILAAAAAAGADSPFVAEATQSPYKRPKAKPEKKTILSGGMRQYVGMAVAGTLLLAAGFGLYWVLGMGRSVDTAAPVLTADPTPIKEPAPVTAPKEDAEGSVVFDQAAAGTATPPADEQIVSRDASVDTSVADIPETVGADGDSGDATAVADGSESELANRKVRTVTVRPDGTIVSGDDAMAGGGGALPVDRPNVPDIPGADVEPSPLLANNAEAPVDTTKLALTPTDTPATATPDPANIDPTIVAPVPMARPTDRSTLGGGSNQKVTAADTSGPVDLTGGATPAAAPAAAPVATSGGAYVQLSSQPTTADAQSSLRTMQNRLSGILGGRSLEIRQVDLGAKGVWYRVVLPTNSFTEATQTCASLKANGTQCVAING